MENSGTFRKSNETPAKKYEETFCHNNRIFLKIIKECFDNGVYFHDYGGGPAHHGFCIQHTNEDISFVLNVLEKILTKNKKQFVRNTQDQI